MSNWRCLFCVGFALTTASGFAQSGSPVEQSTPTPTPTATPVVFSPQTLSDLERLQQAALSSDYAYRQVAHLANNIGPRLTGSAQAAKAVEYVGGELKAIGCEVQLEKVMVPHWVRGEETAALVQWPGMAENTTQKIVLCALGGSVATPASGITAEVVAVKTFDELKALPRDKVAGKIVLFNYPFDKRIAAEGRGVQRMSKRFCIAVAVRSQRQSWGERMFDSVRWRRGLPNSAHRTNKIRRRCAEDSSGCDDVRGRGHDCRSCQTRSG